MSQQKYNQTTERNISSLQTDYAARARQWLAACRQNGLNPYVHFGSRTPAEQQALYEKFLNGDGPKAVAPERSYHCYGRAFDWVNIINPDAGDSGLDWDNHQTYVTGTHLGAPFQIVGIGDSDDDHLQDGNFPSFTDLPKSEFGKFPSASSSSSSPAAPVGPGPIVGPGTTPGADSGLLQNPLFAGDLELRDAANGMRPPYTRGSAPSPEIGLIQTALDRVLPAADRINAGANSGIFGPRTEAAVRKFQAAVGIGVDGQVGRNTLRALDKALTSGMPVKPGPGPGPGPGPASGLDAIIQIAANSAIARYHWNDRGRAPLGYIKGMALVFGRVYCKLASGDAAVLEMARADKGQPSIDAISYYRAIFNEAGKDNSESGAETLRHLFVLMLGLGMRESSGAHCEGRDTTNPDSGTADSAEAGLFQTSWNAHSASPLLVPLFQAYSATPGNGWVDIFHEQVTCSQADWNNVGTGTGAAFQSLSKNNPAFAAEFAAVALRNIKSHWGPIIHRAAEVRPEADEMFKDVQDKIDSLGICPVLV